jgi:hypothetical protein
MRYPMPEIAVDPSHLAQPVLAALKAYWDKQRGERAMPARGDLDPVDLKSYLGWIAMLDALPGFEDFRYRLVGTRIADYFPTDGTGQTIRQAFAPFGNDAATAVLALHQQVARDRRPLYLSGTLDLSGPLGRPDGARFAYESLVLPLSDDGTTTNKLMVGFTFDHAAVALANRRRALA